MAAALAAWAMTVLLASATATAWLVVMTTTALLLQLSAAAARSSPAPVGLPGCNTTCGDVEVPYPFGFGPARCYWPGLNLTCNTTDTTSPRLLLGDGTLRVTDISLENSTVRVFGKAGVLLGANGIDNITYGRWDRYTFFGRSFGDYGYKLSSRNELAILGCSAVAVLLVNITGQLQMLGACSTMCDWDPEWNFLKDWEWDCIRILSSLTKVDGPFCAAPLKWHSSPPIELQISSLVSWPFAVNAVVAEEGWSYHVEEAIQNSHEIPDECPLILQWLVSPDDDVRCKLCKSQHSSCYTMNQFEDTCHCDEGYDGNPYLDGGCQDIDECRIRRIRDECFGECKNLAGSYTCRCPRGSHGNPFLPNACRPSVTGLSIAIGVGSGAGIILLALLAVYMTKQLKHRRSIKLKQKFFKQNRGQLLQQLVAQRADIAERMIVTLEELEKATNNFDRARELGGGGHGTVYKGILSDLHVVAIKKSKIEVQREIDEFINEVAILSQISHRNVVKLYGCCLETQVPLLVYEFVSNGTLYSHLHVQGATSLSWNDRLRIATETAKAIAYLHSATLIPIIHRDIKSTNILLDDTLTSKVSDFGASRHIPIDRTGVTTNVQGTIGYLDPAYYYTGRLTEKSDVYSFGVLLVELLTRKKPYSCVSSDGQGLVAHFVTLYTSGSLVDILDQQVTQEGGSQQATKVAALAVRCVKMSGDERPTMREVEMTLEAIQAKEQTSDNAAAQMFEENSIRRRLPSSGPEGRSMQSMTRQYSLEEEFMLSARYPR